MHVKEQVKELVHDVKRKFSKKHNRDSTCSTCAAECHDGASYTSADTYGTADSASSSDSSLPGTPQRRRLISFLRPRTPSSPSKHHNVLHKANRAGSKRYRLFSAPSMPSMHAVQVSQSSTHRQVATESSIHGSIWEPESIQETAVESGMVEFPQVDLPEVLDISARLVNTDSVVSEQSIFRDSGSQSQPTLDSESRSETSGTSDTLISTASADFKKSVSDSDSRIDVLNRHSDENPAPPVSCLPMEEPNVPPAPPPKSEQPTPTPANADDETVSSPAPAAPSPAVPQVSHATTPTQPMRSTPASPAPVYIPRLTAPSMFLPIPNTDPLSALLTKYVSAEQRPRRDVVGEYAGRDIHEMVMTNSWRALAKMARDRIVASDPEDLARILDLWSLRLSSLARLRLTNQASAECTNLFAVLNAVHPTSAPGAFPGSGSLAPVPLPSSPAPAPSLALSPSGLSIQLPGTPSQKSSTLPPAPHGGPAPAHDTHELVHPFELTVFHARVHYWSGDSLGYVDALSRILRQCKTKAKEEGRIVMQRRELGKADTRRTSGSPSEISRDDDGGGEEKEGTEGDRAQDEADTRTNQDEDSEEGNEDSEESTESAQVQDDILTAAEANLSMWLERVARVCLILASQMIEMNDYQAAINLLAPLCTHRATPAFLPAPSPELHSALARVYLLSGNLGGAEEHFSMAASAAEKSTDGPNMIAMNTALLAAASGDWPRAEEALSDLVAKHPANFTAVNNLAVTLLCQGRINEGIDLLEAALRTSPSSVVVAEPFLFNLSTLYELRSAAAIDKKRELLIKVATWSGDGLKTSCLKMPSS